MPVIMMIGLAVVSLVSLLQVIVVPIVASSRGKDGAVWFIVTVIWLFFNTVLGCIAFFAGFAAVAASASEDPEYKLLAVGGFVVYTVITCLPLIAVMFSGSPAQGRRRGAPARRPRPTTGAIGVAPRRTRYRRRRR